MNPRTLRALLPVLRDAREAGVRRFASGEGEKRIEFELAAPDPQPGQDGIDPNAADEEGAMDPRVELNRHYDDFMRKWGDPTRATANPVETKPEGGTS